MIIDKPRHYGHIVILLLLCRVADGRMDIKVATDHVQVGPLLLPHVQLFAIDKTYVLFDVGRAVELLATNNKTKKGVVWSVSYTKRRKRKTIKDSIAILLQEKRKLQHFKE